MDEQQARSDLDRVVIGLWGRSEVSSGLLRRIAESGTLEVFEPGTAAQAALTAALTPRQREAFATLCQTIDLDAEAAVGELLETRCRARQVQLLVVGRDGYPPRLAATRDAPAVLAVRGDVRVLSGPLVAVVGSRRAEGVGLQSCRELVQGLYERGLWVVSGGALGIDACAHRMALSLGAPTVVVSATGIELAYPRRNQDIYAQAVRRGGAVVTQFPPQTPPRPERFPRRNPTIAGLALATVVVEAPHGSGALHTAAAAQRQGRAVWVVSGLPFRETTAGGHALIKSGDARLLDSLGELTQLERGGAREVRRGSLQVSLPLTVSSSLESAPVRPVAVRQSEPVDASSSGLREAIVARLGLGEASHDELLSLCGGRVEAHALLLGLELDGTLTRAPGGRYRLGVTGAGG